MMRQLLSSLLLFALLCGKAMGESVSENLPKIMGLSPQATQKGIVLQVENGGFDPILHLEKNEKGGYRVLIEAENVLLDAGLQHDAISLKEELSKIFPNLQSVQLFQVLQNKQPVVKIILDVSQKLHPHIQLNTGNQVVIGFVESDSPFQLSSKPLENLPTESPPLSEASKDSRLLSTPTLPAFPINPKELPKSLQPAWQAYAEGEGDKALSLLKGVPHLSPTEEPWREYLRALVATVQANPPQALTILKKAVENFPQFLPTRTLGIGLLIQQGEPELAKTWLDAAKSAHIESPELLFYEALVREAQGDLEQAKSLYQKAIVQTPHPLYYRYRLAILALKQNQPKLAEGQLRQILLYAPDDTSALKLLAYLQQKSNQPEEAIQSYQKALKPDVLINYAQLLYQQKKTEQALLLFEAANLIEPDDPDIQFNLGMLYNQYQQPQLAKARLQHFLEIITQQPSDPRIERAQATLSSLK